MNSILSIHARNAEDRCMIEALSGSLLLALQVGVFVAGLRAPRTRKLALFGLVPAGCSLGALLWWAFGHDSEFIARVAAGLGAISAGLAHGVVFSLVPLSAGRAWLRMILVPLGMWCGTFTSLWFFWPAAGASVLAPLAVLGAGTLAAWLALPFMSRNRGVVASGTRMVPSVRFPCPRCGTRVDWGQGIAACTDCGLFMHIYWPADETHAAATADDSSAAPRSVRFACPSCRVKSDWPCGDGQCADCGLKLTLHWNVHPGRPVAEVAPRVQPRDQA